MRFSFRPRHALVLATVAALTATLSPSAAFATDPGDEQVQSETAQTSSTNSSGAAEETPEPEQPDDGADREGTEDGGDGVPGEEDTTGPEDEAPAEEAERTDGVDGDAVDRKALSPKTAGGTTVDPAGTDDPRFAENAGALAPGATLTQEEMDELAWSTGEDPATLEGGPTMSAASAAGFNPANIVSDRVFYDGSAMSLSQIRSFLDSKVSSCRSGYTCLPDYRENTKSRAADQYCDGYTGRTGESSAEIIYRVAQSCDINPKALIVILQKEQGLVTHTWPSDWRYTIAMGMACPDTAACDTRYYGFQNQVYSAARQYQVYTDSSYFTWYPVGKTSNVRWHPNASCGSAPVTIANKATAALYYYTPYQPNRAALNAGYGTGDSCSSYGNRNFYLYFTDWFGSTHADACTVPSGATSAHRQYVVQYALNARKAPSTACDTGVSSLAKGSIVQATRLSADKDWLEVHTLEGRRWISREYVRYATEAEGACTVPPGTSAAKHQYVVTTSSTAKLAPWAACKQGLRSVGKGTMVQATRISATGKWLQIRTGIGDRWIKRDQVSVCLPPAGTEPASRRYLVKDGTDANEFPMSKCGTAVKNWGAGTSPSRYVGADTVVQATRVSKTGNWLKIRTGVGDRWIPSDEVDVCTEPAGTQPASKRYKVLRPVEALVSPLRMCGSGADHFGTGTEPRALGTGAIVQATRVSASGAWLEVKTKLGLRWVKRSDVTLRY